MAVLQRVIGGYFFVKLFFIDRRRLYLSMSYMQLRRLERQSFRLSFLKADGVGWRDSDSDRVIVMGKGR